MAWQWLSNLVWRAMDDKDTLDSATDVPFSSLGNDAVDDWEDMTTEGEEDEFRLILVGKSGGGKSATGNTILGRREFKSIMSAKTVTLECRMGQENRQGTKISVVDTPAILDSDEVDKMMRDEIRACIEFSRPGPHALIFVTQVGRFTAEDAAAAKRLRDIFGADSTRHTIVLFTCMEDLGGSSLDEYVTQSNNWNLRELIWRCGNRFCGFNNKATGMEWETQVSKLMAIVRKTVLQNGGRYYVNWLYQEPNLRDEHVQRLGEQNQLADKFKYYGWIFRDKFASASQFVLSLLNSGANEDGGGPQLTTRLSLTAQSSDGP